MSDVALICALVVLLVAHAEVRRLRAAIYDARRALGSADCCLCGDPVSQGEHHHTIVTGTDVAWARLVDAELPLAERLIRRWNTRQGEGR